MTINVVEMYDLVTLQLRISLKVEQERKECLSTSGLQHP